MKVVGAGFGRTGTLSLKVALEALGLGPCYHMTETARRPGHARAWLAAVEAAGPFPWRPLLRGYVSTVDWPGVFFWREMVDQCHGCRVILTVRDPESWYDSMSETVFAAAASLSPPRLTRVGALQALARKMILEATFDGRFEHRALAVATFTAHVDAVTAAVDRRRLLVYEVTDGWSPLCRFLDRPVPDIAFPHLNTRANFTGWLRAQSRTPARVPSA